MLKQISHVRTQFSSFRSCRSDTGVDPVARFSARWSRSAHEPTVEQAPALLPPLRRRAVDAQEEVRPTSFTLFVPFMNAVAAHVFAKCFAILCRPGQDGWIATRLRGW